VRCQACGEDNPSGNRFCEACGRPLNRICDACGQANRPDARFCGRCGASLEDPGEADPEAPAAAVPLAERRLVSVLFADLVGFTPIAEGRDPEEVRELLSAYFGRMREVVARHGGTIEKFIGDAVMAVWGTPVAHEDDAERAVRAALSMTAAVAGLRHDLTLPADALDLRVGVLTGEAAITVGAEGQGMVAGDLVNTASRVQAAAAPGTVLVDEATRRASEAAVSFEPAGARDLKGKSSPVPVWRAVRVVSARGGAGRALGLEAPFVGRDEELGLLIELFHAVTREGRARLVSVGGVAGVGKSRLAWEFEKYIDGVTEAVQWHRGRCVAYGEGVT
jgi:class 3 adenylate cyclase